MAPKRKRDASPKGLAPGEPLKRTAQAIASSSWGWVGSEATDTDSISQEHLETTCGLSKWSTHPFCRNKFAKLPPRKEKELPKPRAHINGEIEEDIIVISSDDDEEDPSCTKKSCKNNPNCLNYLGQKKWEDEDEARKIFNKIVLVGSNPAQDARDADLPVGLKNLGATCYANASLQVWFRDMAFRSGVYHCQATEESADKFKDSPIFQLQVTFAALQESTQSVFNPTKLVESLELRTTEQQDAQEFSKLFMSHLDTEFKKQYNPVLKSLITDQFQGKQIYGTICSNCQSVSARDTDFLEIEINFKNNAKLEDSIAALLQEETLSGDNQYLCSTCESLQDATRYTELASLPPVLHFSLLRFVYDLSTMERRKSKHSISFPTTIDMTRFLGNAVDRKSASSSTKKSEGNLYELRGVLLHKGKSAYHGHYEAQVFDDTKHSWFQFNDEIVTKIKKLGDDKKPIIIDVEAKEEEKENTQISHNKQRENARKRRRVEDSDDESSSPQAGPSSDNVPPRPTALYSESRISSKDAYMLIYARREACSSSQDIPVPPSHALDVVNALNAAHDKACESYAEKEKQADICFTETRRKVLDIYQSWNVTSNLQKYIVASQQALENWIEQTAIKAAIPSTPSEPQSISIKDILCSHNLYDHRKAANMKRITLEAYNKIVSGTNCVFNPKLTSHDICRACVEESFLEKLYRAQHSLHVADFDACNTDIDLGSYWISKPWLRDWKLQTPKMHTAGEPDPSPDSGEYLPHVQCQHGGLCLNTSNRTRISIQAFTKLRSLYPAWEPMPGDMELCLVCHGLKNMGEEDRLELRRRADDEKSKLKHMYENALNGNISLLSDVPCALVPEAFVHAWREWVSQPAEEIRPDRIDNTPFICPHEMLAIDPNCPTDIQGSLVVIQRADWDELAKLYSGGPLITIKRINDSQYTHEVAVCTGCRQQRKTNWVTTEITVRMGKQGSKSLDSTTASARSREPITYMSGARQSKRLRQAKEGVRTRKLTVTKSMTLKEIKVELQKELKIPTICQRLFYEGRELDDNTATVASLQILANDIIDLKEENEIHEVSDSEDAPPKSKRRRDEGGGFHGTLLGRTEGRSSSPPKPAEPPAPTEKACEACTFSNPVDILVCDMCDHVFA
ncbi:hypothetical protein DFH07DRAFT_854832 [Mycena maculata]|uniref:ubiquitinyl hydrolase 1 n=1 Tax=Mycena maculata TaxID=230809 RepID=A0AAD7MNR8_9AGAR|nr:hypothetical protein DFH07DRAFT_854832 [Mycena maculata]